MPHLTREKDCTYKSGVCYGEDSARKLALWAAAVKRWAEDAWDLCGPDDGVK